MEKKINDIKNELKAANVSELPLFIEMYKSDERSGVQALIVKAN